MQDDIGTILFLGATDTRNEAPRLAARVGLRSILAPWAQCEAAAEGVVVRGPHEVGADGRLDRLPGVTVLHPVLVAALTASAPAFERGRRLVASSDALWGHCSFAATPHAATHRHPYFEAELLACGVAEFRPSSTPLKLIDATAVARRRDGRARGSRGLAERREAREALQAVLDAVGRDPATALDPALHRVLAPCATALGTSAAAPIDPLTSHAWLQSRFEGWRPAILSWLHHLCRRAAAPKPVRLAAPSRRPIVADGRTSMDGHDDDLAFDDEAFPTLFGTPRHIDTVHVPDAAFVHLDSALEPAPGVADDRVAELHRILCRRRANGSVAATRTERRLVEPGVGRASLVAGVRVTANPELHDFTVLGVGLTPYSEGGYVEIGRKIDGKASLARARHRMVAAERLQEQGCRCGRVVAIVALPGDEIEMPDGTSSPAALIVRGFRCAYRVKQLDPLICCLHSTQHTPLVSAFLAERARELRSGARLPPARTALAGELLAQAIEAQGASQESLRELLAADGHDPSEDWLSFVRQARLDAIDAYAPCLIGTAKRRLARELGAADGEMPDEDYLRWFAGSVGAQLAAWRRLRFLHDYHHPGISRWMPGHLHTLGENNVTLLAEFPDLDTGVFVDDLEAELDATLQLGVEDATVLRERYPVLHQRDVQSAEAVVRTLALLLFRGDKVTAETATGEFRSAYGRA